MDKQQESDEEQQQTPSKNLKSSLSLFKSFGNKKTATINLNANVINDDDDDDDDEVGGGLLSLHQDILEAAIETGQDHELLGLIREPTFTTKRKFDFDENNKVNVTNNQNKFTHKIDKFSEIRSEIKKKLNEIYENNSNPELFPNNFFESKATEELIQNNVIIEPEHTAVKDNNIEYNPSNLIESFRFWSNLWKQKLYGKSSTGTFSRTGKSSISSYGLVREDFNSKLQRIKTEVSEVTSNIEIAQAHFNLLNSKHPEDKPLTRPEYIEIMDNIVKEELTRLTHKMETLLINQPHLQKHLSGPLENSSRIFENFPTHTHLPIDTIFKQIKDCEASDNKSYWKNSNLTKQPTHLQINEPIMIGQRRRIRNLNFRISSLDETLGNLEQQLFTDEVVDMDNTEESILDTINSMYRCVYVYSNEKELSKLNTSVKLIESEIDLHTQRLRNAVHFQNKKILGSEIKHQIDLLYENSIKYDELSKENKNMLGDWENQSKLYNEVELTYKKLNLLELHINNIKDTSDLLHDTIKQIRVTIDKQKTELNNSHTKFEERISKIEQFKRN